MYRVITYSLHGHSYLCNSIVNRTAILVTELTTSTKASQAREWSDLNTVIQVERNNQKFEEHSEPGVKELWEKLLIGPPYWLLFQ